MMKKTFKVNGMHCKSCEMLVADSLEELDGVGSAMLSHEKGTAEVTYDSNKMNDDKIRDIIKQEGYEVE